MRSLGAFGGDNSRQRVHPFAGFLGVAVVRCKRVQVVGQCGHVGLLVYAALGLQLLWSHFDMISNHATLFHNAKFKGLFPTSSPKLKG